MRLPDELSEAQHRAIVEALRILATRGRQLRLEREARERAAQSQNVMPTDTLRGVVTAGESDGAANPAAKTEDRLRIHRD